MNYLDIARGVNNTVGFQGTVNSVDVGGYQAVLLAAINDTYIDIQKMRADWNFLKTKRDVNVSEIQNEYTPEELWGTDTVDLAEYDYINFNYRRIPEINYEDFVLIDPTTGGSGEPKYYAIDPASKNLLISPVDQVYTLQLHYIKSLDTLVNSTDVPIIPARHHMAIVYGAILKLSTYVGNITLFDTYNVQYSKAMGELMREELPPKRVIKRPIV